MTRDPESHDPLGTELVKLALAAWPTLPHLVSDYLGPTGWLHASRSATTSLDVLHRRALTLGESAERAGDGYVAIQARAVAAQIETEMNPFRYRYVELIERLLSCKFAPPDSDEIEALSHEVDALAANLGFKGETAIARWESARLVTGEDKWDAAIEAYRVGRAYALGQFPIHFEERLEIARTDDPITSLHLTWRHPDRLVFEVNVNLARTPATTAYEVAHNIYPGDYLHMAVLTQHTYADEGRVAACIKLKNAPENVIAEGIEELASFRLDPNPNPESLLAWKLEWLRRGACLTGAILRRERMESKDVVVKHLQRTGHMAETRARQELDRIEHPLWGTYQYTYWLGRKLVEAADRSAGRLVTSESYLRWLYGGLHVPETFLADGRRVLAAKAPSHHSESDPC